MRPTNLGALVFGTILAAATFMSGTDAKSDSTSNGGGTAAVYGNIPADQVEFLSTPEHIMSVVTSGAGSAAVWETLEHAETVECLDCIPLVEHLLYDTDPQNREIAAWWMRKRMFGVFGPGEAYERNLKVLSSDADPQKRAYAAYAVGEFLTLAGVTPLANAIANDSSPKVRAAAASALGRLNDDGAGALSKAMGDSDTSVRLAAINSAGRVNSFTDVATATKLVGDSSPLVRRRGAELLEELHAKDSVMGLIALVQSDNDAQVRASAAHALGVLKDTSAKTTLQHAADTDADQFVRDQAAIALRRM
jgi:HEAT repeat protein